MPRTLLLSSLILVTAATFPTDDDRAVLARRAKELTEKLTRTIRQRDDKHPEVQALRIELGDVFMKLALPKKALPHYGSAEEVLMETSERLDATLVLLRCSISEALESTAERGAATKFLRPRIGMLGEHRGEGMTTPEKIRLGWAQYLYALEFHRLGEFSDALILFTGSLAVCTEVRGEGHLETIDAAVGIAACNIELGKLDAAKPLLVAALATLEEKHPTETARIRLARNNLGVVYKDLGEFERALATFESVLAEMVNSGVERTSEPHILALENHLRCLDGLGRTEMALLRVDELLDLLGKLRPRSRWKANIKGWSEKRKEWRRAAKKRDGPTEGR